MSTQTQHPWRATLRTVVAATVGALLLLPVLADAGVISVELMPWLAGPLAVAAAITRALAIPQVEAYLRRHRLLSWLAAEPRDAAPADTGRVGFTTSPELGKAEAVPRAQP